MARPSCKMCKQLENINKRTLFPNEYRSEVKEDYSIITKKNYKTFSKIYKTKWNGIKFSEQVRKKKNRIS